MMPVIRDIAEWSAYVSGILLVADALSGLAHWLEDTYFSPTTPLLGRTISRNVLHHLEPGAFVLNPWHVTIRSSVVAAIVFSALLSAAGLLDPFMLTSISLATFGNLVHKWAHTPVGDLPRLVVWAQRFGLLQSPAHHAMHHARDKVTHYCVLTNMVNPLLDGLGAWRVIELCVSISTGARKRPDPSLSAASA